VYRSDLVLGIVHMYEIGADPQKHHVWFYQSCLMRDTCVPHVCFIV